MGEEMGCSGGIARRQHLQGEQHRMTESSLDTDPIIGHEMGKDSGEGTTHFVL
jgi:hypothetical protein